MVEYLDSEGKWQPLPDASITGQDQNAYEVTLRNFPGWLRVHSMDGQPLRINGQPSFRTWGTRKTGGTLNSTLVLHVLV